MPPKSVESGMGRKRENYGKEMEYREGRKKEREGEGFGARWTGKGMWEGKEVVTGSEGNEGELCHYK
jgi:hypothetical protein